METEYYCFSLRYSSLTQSQHPVPKISLNKQFLIFMFFKKYLQNTKINGFPCSFHQTCLHMQWLNVMTRCSSYLENFFKLVLGFLLKFWGAERKKPLKHILFLPLDLRSLQSNDSEQKTNWKAAGLSWLPSYHHKFDLPWNIIFRDWKDNRLNSALSYSGATPTLLSFFTIVRTYFISEENFVYRVYRQYYRKNTIYTAGLICCFYFTAGGVGSRVNDCNHTTKSIIFEQCMSAAKRNRES